MVRLLIPLLDLELPVALLLDFGLNFKKILIRIFKTLNPIPNPSLKEGG
jgi:hypothetical protein